MDNKFFTSHNTVPFLIIKTGLLGPLVFFRLSFLAVMKFVIRKDKINLFIPLFAIYILMNFGYGMKNFILISFMISYLSKYLKDSLYEM